MRLPQLVQWLERYLDSELDARKRIAALLEAQQDAVVSGLTADIERTGVDLDAELRREPARERDRRELLTELGRVFGVPASMLTVRSIVERIEQHGVPSGRIAELRREVRAAALDVKKRARKLSTLAKGHGELLTDVMRTLLGSEPERMGGGILVDAEA